jgi:prephenate dehydratase
MKINPIVVMFQALAQCENTLTKLGLVREAVDDTAGAAKVGMSLGFWELIFFSHGS